MIWKEIQIKTKSSLIFPEEIQKIILSSATIVIKSFLFLLVPTTEPEIQITPETVSSFRVTWKEIPIEHRHGVIDRYKLWYGTRQKMTVLELSGDSRSYLITGTVSPPPPTLTGTAFPPPLSTSHPLPWVIYLSTVDLQYTASETAWRSLFWRAHDVFIIVLIEWQAGQTPIWRDITCRNSI